MNQPAHRVYQAKSYAEALQRSRTLAKPYDDRDQRAKVCAWEYGE